MKYQWRPGNKASFCWEHCQCVLLINQLCAPRRSTVEWLLYRHAIALLDSIVYIYTATCNEVSTHWSYYSLFLRWMYRAIGNWWCAILLCTLYSPQGSSLAFVMYHLKENLGDVLMEESAWFAVCFKYVSVLSRNQRIFLHVFWSHCCIQLPLRSGLIRAS